MRRMITDKELSFFDYYAKYGTAYKHASKKFDITGTDTVISEYSGAKNLKGYIAGTSATSPSKLTFDFNGAEAECLLFAYHSTIATVVIKNLTMNTAQAAFYGNSISSIAFQNCKLLGNGYNFANGASNLISITGDCDASKLSNITLGFAGCTKLADLSGIKHWRVSFDISASTQFNAAALVEIISNLDDTGSAHTLTIGATNLAKLSKAQIKVATDKGWNLA